MLSVTTVGARVRVGLAAPQPLAAEISAASARELDLRPGTRAVASFKAARPESCNAETEEHRMKLSARNQLSATVTGITQGEAIANVALDAGGVRLVASITREAADELGLQEGSEVVAVVKASDVILAVKD